MKLKLLILFIVLLTGGVALCSRSQETDQSAAPAARAKSKRAVSCLGRLVPGERVIQLAGPQASQGPAMVKELYVRRGERVTKGGQVAKLLSFDISEAQLRQAEAETEVQARLLDQVRAGEKAGTIAAQEATVLRLEAEMENTAIVLKRDQELFNQKTISQNDFDRSELALRVARKNHEQAVSQLASLKEIRAVDIRVAEARLKAATETARRIRVELEQAIIRSPIDGVVLEVRAYPGERLENTPLVELGELDKMRVESEVYVTDIAQVRVGARAKVSGDGITGELAGVVSEIGLQVDRSSVFNPDPASFNDKRVVKVWITLEETSQVRGLANHQVQVRIVP